MGCYFSVLYCLCLYTIKRVSFNAGDFALVPVVQAWAAAAVGAFVLPFLATFRRAL